MPNKSKISQTEYFRNYVAKMSPEKLAARKEQKRLLEIKRYQKRKAARLAEVAKASEPRVQ